MTYLNDLDWIINRIFLVFKGATGEQGDIGAKGAAGRKVRFKNLVLLLYVILIPVYE